MNEAYLAIITGGFAALVAVCKMLSDKYKGHASRMRTRSADRDTQARLVATLCNQVASLTTATQKSMEDREELHKRINDLESDLAAFRKRVAELEQQLEGESCARATAEQEIRELRAICDEQTEAIDVLTSQLQTAGIPPAALPPKRAPRKAAPRKKAK